MVKKQFLDGTYASQNGRAEQARLVAETNCYAFQRVKRHG